MRRYWIDANGFTEDEVQITGDDFHHICVVCRQGVGNQFEVIVDGQAYLVEISSMAGKKAIAKVLEARTLPQPKPPLIHLALSLPRFQTVDRVVEKMVELGVHKVHLFSSDFSFMKPKPKELEKKMERWRKIIRGATQQTGRGDLMELTEIVPLSVLLQGPYQDGAGLGLLAYEGEGGMGLGQRLKEEREPPKNLWIFVGAEGGFSDKDLKIFSDYNILPTSLGDQVLRVETACVTLVSILRYAFSHYD